VGSTNSDWGAKIGGEEKICVCNGGQNNSADYQTTWEGGKGNQLEFFDHLGITDSKSAGLGGNCKEEGGGLFRNAAKGNDRE